MKIRYQADDKGEMSSKSQESETEPGETHPDRVMKKTMITVDDKSCKETNAETEDEFGKVSNRSGPEQGKRLSSKEKTKVLEITEYGNWKRENPAKEEETLADHKSEEQNQSLERKSSRRSGLVPVSI